MFKPFGAIKGLFGAGSKIAKPFTGGGSKPFGPASGRVHKPFGDRPTGKPNRATGTSIFTRKKNKPAAERTSAAGHTSGGMSGRSGGFGFGRNKMAPPE